MGRVVDSIRQDFYVVTDRIDDVRRALGLIGSIASQGCFRRRPRQATNSAQVSADELKQRLPSNDLVVIDVRNDSEWKGDISPTRFTSRSASSRSASTNSRERQHRRALPGWQPFVDRCVTASKLGRKNVGTHGRIQSLEADEKESSRDV